MAVWHAYPLPGTGEPGRISLRVTSSLSGRDLLVALPPGYAQAAQRYPVVYLQDGQNQIGRASCRERVYVLV